MSEIEEHRNPKNKRATGSREKLVMAMVRSAKVARDHSSGGLMGNFFTAIAEDIEQASSDALCVDLMSAMREELETAKVAEIKRYCEEIGRRFGALAVVPIAEILTIAH